MYSYKEQPSDIAVSNAQGLFTLQSLCLKDVCAMTLPSEPQIHGSAYVRSVCLHGRHVSYGYVYLSSCV